MSIKLKRHTIPADPTFGSAGYTFYTYGEGRFKIMPRGLYGHQQWVVFSQDGTTPFDGYRGKKGVCRTKLCDTLSDVRDVIARVLDAEVRSIS